MTMSKYLLMTKKENMSIYLVDVNWVICPEAVEAVRI